MSLKNARLEVTYKVRPAVDGRSHNEVTPHERSPKFYL
jgi:hypothetical protein